MIWATASWTVCMLCCGDELTPTDRLQQLNITLWTILASNLRRCVPQHPRLFLQHRLGMYNCYNDMHNHYAFKQNHMFTKAIVIRLRPMDYVYNYHSRNITYLD